LLLANDFGLILDQTVGGSGNGEKSSFDYSGILVPRFSTFWGEGSEFYISAGVKADYVNEQWSITPELLRTELSLGLGSGALKIGRMLYTDPLGYITDGLFDGMSFSFETAVGGFSAGAWYTGLLNKNRAGIAMTAKEQASLYKALDYSNFTDTYFAPSRVLAAVDWENPSLAYLFMVNAGLLGQFDLSGEKLHSQYFMGKISMPLNSFVFNLGGSLGLIQDKGDTGLAFSGDLGAAWMIPSSLPNRLLLTAHYTSGRSGTVKAFLPVTTVSQGFVLKANHSGITTLTLDYAAKLNPSFSINVNLQTGRIRVDVNPPAGTRTSMKVSSPIATASVRGTSFEMDPCRVIVVEGRVGFRGKSRGLVIIDGRYESSVSVDGKSSNPYIDMHTGFKPAAPVGYDVYSGGSSSSLSDL
jgi:hypothetical protein